MSDGSLKTLKQNLEIFNSELGLPLEKEQELNTYNELFLNTLSSNIQNVLDIEAASLEKINNVSNMIDGFKKDCLDYIEEEKKIISVKYSEKYNSNRDIYEIERKKISIELEKNNDSFYKQLEDINFDTYRRNLSVTQSNADYLTSIKNINHVYKNSIDFLYIKKDYKIKELTKEKEKSKIKLKNQLSQIKEHYEDESCKLETEKLQQDSSVEKKQSEQEKVIFQQKINLNSKLDSTSNYYSAIIKTELIPFKNHIEYLNSQLELLKQQRNDEEIIFLDKFKLNLESVDKQIEVNKNEYLASIDKINESSTSKSTKEKEIKSLDAKYKVFQEKMRRKKIEYDIDKNFKIKRMILINDHDIDIIKKQKFFFQEHIKNIEIINSNKEFCHISKLRNEIELNELKIKHSIDVIKQTKSYNDTKNKINKDFSTNAYLLQLNLYNENIVLNNKYHETVINNISISTSLEIEKNLILKRYNQNLNDLLQKHNSYSANIIKKDEAFEIQLKKLKLDFINKSLAQDIQYANKKQELNKQIQAIEKEYDEAKIVADYNFKLDKKINKIFENRFKIEKNLYNIYFTAINQQNDFILDYFARFFFLTKSKKDNVSFAIFEYISNYINYNISSLMDKTIKIVEDRITFEGTVNFEYELNRLISQKEQNELIYNVSLQKMIETSDNYSKTILLYEDKIFNLQKESDKTNNLIILKDLDLKNTYVKNTPATITKIHNDILLLKESYNIYKADIKSYEVLITKNKKLIQDIKKSIEQLKTNHNKKTQSITNDIDSIEKKHKNDSNVYYTFINQVSNFKKDLLLNLNAAKSEKTYKLFKKHTLDISINTKNFMEKNIETLFLELNNRHDKINLLTEQKNLERINNAKTLFQQDIKRVCYNYNDEIFEIEKRVDRLYSTYKYKKKDLIISHKEKIQNIKNKQNQLEVIKRQSKAKLFYDVNTFTENIENHESLNSKTINDITLHSKNSSKKFNDIKNTSNDERIKRINLLDIEHNNILLSFKKQLNCDIEYKNNQYNSKIVKSNQLITNIKNDIRKLDITYKEYVNIRGEELNESVKVLTSEYRKDIETLNKKIESKINKQTKKFNKENN